MIPCSHIYKPCPVDGYERCCLCGTYHSTESLPAEEIYDSGYWSGHRSSIWDQNYNVDVHTEVGRTKNQFALSLVEVEDRSAALEIACAPGSLLKRLRQEAGFRRVTGCEVDSEYETAIREISGGAELIFGYFPQSTAHLAASSYSLVIGLDVFEHMHDPASFLQECSRLLKANGQLILMLPIATPGAELQMPQRFFSPAEHVFVHSPQHIRMMLEWAGFDQVRFGRWCFGHETVSARAI